MIEIMVVMAVGLVLLAMVAPLVSSTINTYRLRDGGEEYANMLQTARTRAVVGDSYYPVYATPGTLAATGGSYSAFVDLNGTGLYQAAPAADPAVAFNPLVVIQPRGAAPNTVNLEAQFMPGIAPGVVAINPNAWGPTFSARGLPCDATNANPANGTCPTTTPAPGNQPVAFETFIQNTFTGRWEAITVNPSGRVRLWQFNNATGAWTPLD